MGETTQQTQQTYRAPAPEVFVPALTACVYRLGPVAPHAVTERTSEGKSMPLRNEPATPDTLLTVPEVAGMLKVSIRSIRRLIAHKELTVVLIGRSVRISSKSLKTFIKKNSQ